MSEDRFRIGMTPDVTCLDDVSLPNLEEGIGGIDYPQHSNNIDGSIPLSRHAKTLPCLDETHGCHKQNPLSRGTTLESRGFAVIAYTLAVDQH